MSEDVRVLTLLGVFIASGPALFYCILVQNYAVCFLIVYAALLSAKALYRVIFPLPQGHEER